jgi:hypothetical protein
MKRKPRRTRPRPMALRSNAQRELMARMLLLQDRESPRLVRERMRYGKPTCRCAEDSTRRHGPNWYLSWEELDRGSWQTRYRREYVPLVELARVRK